MTATVTPTTASNKTVNWTTSNSSVATVNSTGLVTIAGVGSATITATTVDGSKTSTSSITGNPVLVSSVDIPEAPYTGTVGDIHTLVANVLPANATNKTLSWSSSDTNIVTVDSTGKITLVAQGTATVTAASTDGSNKAASCGVVVNAA